MNRITPDTTGPHRPDPWPGPAQRHGGLAAVRRRIAAGRPLFHEADAARHLYEIAAGAVRMSRLQADGRRQIIGFGFRGDVVGLPSGGRHTTECAAITDCDILLHPIQSLTDPGFDPGLHPRLVEAALREIRALQDHLVILGRRLALERVAAFLLHLLGRGGAPADRGQRILLPMSRSDIADYLGLTPETVSRAFSALRARRVVALEGANTVIVLAAGALQALSGEPAEAARKAGGAGASRLCHR